MRRNKSPGVSQRCSFGFSLRATSTRCLPVFLLFGGLLSPIPSQAQPPAPQTYSIIENSRMIMDAFLMDNQTAEVKVSRNSAREVVEVTAPSPQGKPNAVHVRYLYDFQTHKVYIDNVSHKSCNWMHYTSDDAPASYDPLSPAMAVQLQEASSHGGKNVGKESIAGIPSLIKEFSSPENGTSRIWIAEKEGFALKIEMIAEGKPITMLEVNRINFDKPTDDLFTPPVNCTTQTQGEMSDSGFSAHSETTIEAHASGSADLASNKTQGEGSATLKPANTLNPSPTPITSSVRAQNVLGATLPQGPRVTTVTLHVDPVSYSGSCPSHAQLIGEITADGPGTVWYRFLAGALGGSPENTVTFEGAGTKRVAMDGVFNSTPRVPAASLLAIMADSQGNHGPQNQSAKVSFSFSCTEPSPGGK